MMQHSLDVLIFPLLTSMCSETNVKKYEMIGIVIVSIVLILLQ